MENLKTNRNLKQGPGNGKRTPRTDTLREIQADKTRKMGGDENHRLGKGEARGRKEGIGFHKKYLER